MTHPATKNSANMNLAERARHAGLGAIAGALVACLVMTFSVASLIGEPDTATMLTYGLVIGALFGALRQERWVYGLAVLVMVAHFLLVDTPWMDRTAARWIRNDGKHPPPGQDAIVVLSAYLETDSLINSVGLDRLLTGVDLYREGVAPRIVTSKIDLSDDDPPRTSTADHQHLLWLMGVDTAKAWIEVDSVKTTRDEATRSAGRLLPLGAKRIVLVTTPMHTRRACATFEAVGFTVFCYPARERRTQTNPPTNSDARLVAFGEYLYERLGMAKYRWNGWVR